MQRACYRGSFPVPAEELFAWHLRPGALRRLSPPWESMQIVDPGSGVQVGSRVELRVRVGPFARSWVSEHVAVEPGRLFRDDQLSGPFALWQHTHEVTPQGAGSAQLEDRIDYAVPLGRLGELVAGQFVRGKLDAVFAYRHRTLRADLQRHAAARASSGRRQLRVAVSGSSGLVGSALTAFLETGGHHVTRLVRRPVCAADCERSRGPGLPGELEWDPEQGLREPERLAGYDAVVHLAGANIAGKRWSPAWKRAIRDSRVGPTTRLAQQLGSLSERPGVLVCASAIGLYGNRGDERLDESSAPGSGFLAELAQAWEQATEPASIAGMRVVNARFGLILSPAGGALARLLPPFRLGLGGPVGNGRQFMSWIAIDDAVDALYAAITGDNLAGALNVVAPEPVTNRDFARALGRALRRPARVPLPASAARLALGGMADELLLASQKVIPSRLVGAGFAYRTERLEDALAQLLGKRGWT